MPTPRKGESRQAFVSRCIPFVMKEGKAKNTKHASGLCYGIYDSSKKKRRR